MTGLLERKQTDQFLIGFLIRLINLIDWITDWLNLLIDWVIDWLNVLIGLLERKQTDQLNRMINRQFQLLVYACRGRW
jgi:hypothetical protein